MYFGSLKETDECLIGQLANLEIVQRKTTVGEWEEERRRKQTMAWFTFHSKRTLRHSRYSYPRRPLSTQINAYPTRCPFIKLLTASVKLCGEDEEMQLSVSE